MAAQMLRLEPGIADDHVHGNRDLAVEKLYKLLGLESLHFAREEHLFVCVFRLVHCHDGPDRRHQMLRAQM